ncbi:hypothetical protein BGW39_009450 [Mortierella sp. 14UC]|nr:hypothetical protein BGW39_009450 [Mortierella sp. 14UC]
MQFSTLIAMAVATSMALLSKTASAECPLKCPSVIDRVCGQNSEGVQHTFTNQCLMTILNCKHTNEWKVISRGYCPNDLQKRAAFDPENVEFPQPGCSQWCPDVISPVCAQDKDGKQVTFANSCHLNTAKCEYPAKNWTQISSRTCSGDLS